MGSGGLGVLESGGLIHPVPGATSASGCRWGKLRSILDERDTLVHCMQGKHRSGGFLIFVLSLICSEEDADDMINKYMKMDP